MTIQRALIFGLFVLALGMLLQGCVIFTPRQDIPVSQTLPVHVQEVQKVINRSVATLGAGYSVVADNVTDGVWTKAEGRAYIAKLDEFRKRVLQAQKLLDDGLWDLANADAKVVDALIVALHAEIAAKRRKE